MTSTALRSQWQYFSSFAKGAALPRCHLAPVESEQPSGGQL